MHYEKTVKTVIVNNSPKLTSTSHLKPFNTKRPYYMTTEIQILASDRHKNVARLNQLMGSEPSLSRLFDLWWQYRYKQTI